MLEGIGAFDSMFDDSGATPADVQSEVLVVDTVEIADIRLSSWIGTLATIGARVASILYRIT
jgi:hypothetical protein